VLVSFVEIQLSQHRGYPERDNKQAADYCACRSTDMLTETHDPWGSEQANAKNDADSLFPDLMYRGADSGEYDHGGPKCRDCSPQPHARGDCSADLVDVIAARRLPARYR
jgi:hypothetical protein